MYRELVVAIRNPNVYCDTCGIIVIAGQSVAIFPPSVSGEVGDSVTIFCVAGLVQDDNSLEIFNTTLNTFINYETSDDGRARLNRVDDPNNNTLTSYTISPLRSTDNGAVFRCGDIGGNSTISVICKFNKFKHWRST